MNHTNGISVPKEYKHMLKQRVPRDNDQREADIRQLIEARPGKRITAQDFVEATGATSAMLHVRRLMKGGYITRHKMPGQGHNYGYKWHAEPLTPKVAALKNGETITRNLNLPPVLLSDVEFAHLKGIYHDWLDQAINISGADFEGARKLIKWIDEQNNKAKDARKKAFDKKEADSDNAS